jgi:hypothetical protein
MLVGLCVLAAGWYLAPGVERHQAANVLAGGAVALFAVVAAAREARNVRAAPWRF